MAIDPSRYGKGKRRAKDHAVQLNVRLLRERSRDKPDAREVVSVLQELLNSGSVPDGWKFAAIDWRRPSRATSGWRTGRLADFDNFRPVLEAAIDGARVAITRRGDVEIVESFETTTGAALEERRAQSRVDRALERVERWTAEAEAQAARLARYTSARWIRAAQADLARAERNLARAYTDYGFYASQVDAVQRSRRRLVRLATWEIEIGIDYGV